MEDVTKENVNILALSGALLPFETDPENAGKTMYHFLANEGKATIRNTADSTIAWRTAMVIAR